jgi:nucleoside-diphosphate-sugar epimerase
MKILVTGNLGYVGSVLSPLLARAGHEVVGLDAGYFVDCTIGPLAGTSVARQITKDIRDVDKGDVEGLDAVVHLAGLSNDPMGEIYPELTTAINLRASETLADLAKDAGVRRFVFASSCSIYGQGESAALNEDSPINPLTAYARSKVDFETSLASLAGDDFFPISLRNATAYGFSPRLRIDLVVNNLMASALTTGEVRLLSDGTAWRPLVNVHDMSMAFVAALEVDRSNWSGLTLNVGSEYDNYQVRDLAGIVSELVPGSTVTVAKGAAADSRNYSVSFERIREVLREWSPAYQVPSGSADLCERMKGARFGQNDFDGHRYSRLGQLKHHRTSGKLDARLRWV